MTARKRTKQTKKIATRKVNLTPMPHQLRSGSDEVSRALDQFFDFAAAWLPNASIYIHDAPRTERQFREIADTLDELAYKYEVAKASNPEKAYPFISPLESNERLLRHALHNVVQSVGGGIPVTLNVEAGSKVQIERVKNILDSYERVAFLIQFGGARPYSLRERIEAQYAVDFWKRKLFELEAMWSMYAQKFKQRERTT